MPDFVLNGQPFEMPEDAANQGYATISAPLGTTLASKALEFSAMRYPVEAAERGLYAGASPYDIGLAQEFANEGYAAGVGVQLPQGGSIKTPMMSADDINDQYGPIGPDGNKVKIADAPMPQGVARLIGQEKANQIQREGIIARFDNAHSWPVNLATNVAGFLMDPMNLTTSFLPGIGEGAVLSRLGTGVGARLIARGVGGATAGAIAQTPLTALRYGLSGEEAQDYSLRDAMRDIAFSAGTSAFANAALGLLVRTPTEKVGGPSEKPEIPTGTQGAPSLPISADLSHNAMRTAISQIIDGRPIDVFPVLDAEDLSLASKEAALRDQHAATQDFIDNLTVHPQAQQAAETLARLSVIDQQLSVEGLSKDDRNSLLRRRDELLTDTTPEKLKEQATSGELARQAANERDNIAGQLSDVVSKRTALQAQRALSPIPKVPQSPADVAQSQRELYSNGFATGLPVGDVGRAVSDFDASANETRQEPDIDNELKIADEGRGGAGYTAQDEADISQADRSIKDAESKASAYSEAALCIVEGGG